jgi:hypothetical protein
VEGSLVSWWEFENTRRGAEMLRTDKGAEIVRKAAKPTGEMEISEEKETRADCPFHLGCSVAFLVRW